MKSLLVCGARPNYMKIAPIIWAIRAFNASGNGHITPILVHTGQHYDPELFDVFFRDLDLPDPDYCLDVGSGSHAHQTGEVMKRIEPIMEEQQPDIVVVVGDVNSTVAAGLAAAKLRIPVGHVEAGLRSRDRTMPEEINRLVTDVLSDFLFVTEEDARDNLLREGIEAHKIFFVGNVMIDALERSRESWGRSTIRERLGLDRGTYGLVTLHRPSNVDSPDTLRGLVKALDVVAERIPIVFPVHPRTRARLQAVGAWAEPGESGKAPRRNGVSCVDALGYLDFMFLLANARIVLTDSGGVQEETTALGIPCLTLRDNTERPATVTYGTNRVVGNSPERVVAESLRVLAGPAELGQRPPLWDGRAADRIVDVLWRRLGMPA